MNKLTRTRKFFINVFFSALLSVVSMLAGFIVPKIMLVYYGSSINGLVSSVTQFINYFSVVEAGLSAASVFALYKPLANKNKKEINEVVSTTKHFYYKSGLIFLLLVTILAVFYPLIVSTDVMNKFQIIALVFIIGASGILDFFTLAKYRTLLTADQRLYVISIASIIGIVINTLIILLFSVLGMDIIIVRFFALFSVLTRSIILILYVKKQYKDLNFNLKPKKDLLKKRWDALYLQILGSFQNGSPYIILTIFSDLISVSIYTIYNMIMMGVNNLLSIFISGLSSSFGEIIAKKEDKTLRESYNLFEYVYYNLLTISYSLTYVLIIPFIRLFTKGITDANYILPTTALLFVLNGLLYNLKTPQGMLIHSSGMYKETKVQTTIQALIILIFGVLLTPKYGINGILFASILSNIYRTIDLIYFVPKYITKTNRITTILRIIKVFILGASIYFIGNYFMFNTNTYFDWLIYAIISMMFSIIIILLFDFVLENNMLKSAYKKILLIFRRKKI